MFVQYLPLFHLCRCSTFCFFLVFIFVGTLLLPLGLTFFCSHTTRSIDVRKLKSKEAKNVADILELAPTFRKLTDAYAATPNAAGTLETEDGGAAEAVDGASFSRLAVGLAVRQVSRAELL